MRRLVIGTVVLFVSLVFLALLCGARVHAARTLEWQRLDARIAQARVQLLARRTAAPLDCAEALKTFPRLGGVRFALWVPAGFQGLRDDFLLPSLISASQRERARGDEGVLQSTRSMLVSTAIDGWLQADAEQSVFGVDVRSTDLFVLAVPLVSRDGRGLRGSLWLDVVRYDDGRPVCRGSIEVALKRSEDPKSSLRDVYTLVQHALAPSHR